MARPLGSVTAAAETQGRYAAASEISKMLSFPQELTVQLIVGDGPSTAPFACGNVALSIRTRPAAKNPYDLGPFFTDDTGRVVISAAMLAAAATAQLSTGLMDYAGVDQGAPTVDLHCWTAEEVLAALEVRTKTWTDILPGEELIYGTVEQLIARLRSARNGAISSGSLPLDWGRPLDRMGVELRVMPKPG